MAEAVSYADSPFAEYLKEVDMGSVEMPLQITGIEQVPRPPGECGSEDFTEYERKEKISTSEKEGKLSFKPDTSTKTENSVLNTAPLGSRSKSLHDRNTEAEQLKYSLAVSALLNPKLSEALSSYPQEASDRTNPREARAFVAKAVGDHVVTPLQWGEGWESKGQLLPTLYVLAWHIFSFCYNLLTRNPPARQLWQNGHVADTNLNKESQQDDLHHSSKSPLLKTVIDSISIFQNFDLAVAEALNEVKTVECINWGLSISEPLPPISRLEASALAPSSSSYNSNCLTANSSAPNNMKSVKLRMVLRDVLRSAAFIYGKATASLATHDELLAQLHTSEAEPLKSSNDGKLAVAIVPPTALVRRRKERPFTWAGAPPVPIEYSASHLGANGSSKGENKGRTSWDTDEDSNEQEQEKNAISSGVDNPEISSGIAGATSFEREEVFGGLRRSASVDRRQLPHHPSVKSAKNALSSSDGAPRTPLRRGALESRYSQRPSSPRVRDSIGSIEIFASPRTSSEYVFDRGNARQPSATYQLHSMNVSSEISGKGPATNRAKPRPCSISGGETISLCGPESTTSRAPYSEAIYPGPHEHMDIALMAIQELFNTMHLRRLAFLWKTITRIDEDGLAGDNWKAIHNCFINVSKDIRCQWELAREATKEDFGETTLLVQNHLHGHLHGHVGFEEEGGGGGEGGLTASKGRSTAHGRLNLRQSSPLNLCEFLSDTGDSAPSSSIFPATLFRPAESADILTEAALHRLSPRPLSLSMSSSPNLAHNSYAHEPPRSRVPSQSSTREDYQLFQPKANFAPPNPLSSSSYEVLSKHTEQIMLSMRSISAKVHLVQHDFKTGFPRISPSGNPGHGIRDDDPIVSRLISIQNSIKTDLDSLIKEWEESRLVLQRSLLPKLKTPNKSSPENSNIEEHSIGLGVHLSERESGDETTENGSGSLLFSNHDEESVTSDWASNDSLMSQIKIPVKRDSEEVFEAVAGTRAGMSQGDHSSLSKKLTRDERIRMKKEENLAKRDALNKNELSGGMRVQAGMVAELKDVLNVLKERNVLPPSTASSQRPANPSR